MGNMDMAVMECMDIVAGKNGESGKHTREDYFSD